MKEKYRRQMFFESQLLPSSGVRLQMHRPGYLIQTIYSR